MRALHESVNFVHDPEKQYVPLTAPHQNRRVCVVTASYTSSIVVFKFSGPASTHRRPCTCRYQLGLQPYECMDRLVVYTLKWMLSMYVYITRSTPGSACSTRYFIRILYLGDDSDNNRILYLLRALPVNQYSFQWTRARARARARA